MAESLSGPILSATGPDAGRAHLAVAGVAGVLRRDSSSSTTRGAD
jgi:hypothetical protein